MCAMSPEVVDFPLVPVTVIISFLIYFVQYFKNLGQIFNASKPEKDVPEDLPSILIAKWAILANIKAI